MAFRYLTLLMSGVLTAAVAASSHVHPRTVHLAKIAGPSHLKAYGSRSAVQRHSVVGQKFDATLAEIARQAGGISSAHPIADLHVMNPAAKFVQLQHGGPALVAIDAVTRGDPQALKAALLGLGLQRAASYSNAVGGLLPVVNLERAAQLGVLHSIRASLSHTRSGAVTTQGDFVESSDVLRSANALSGAGVTIGVMSDSFNCYAAYATHGVPASGLNGYANNGFTADATADISSGDLPSSVHVLQEADCLNYGAPLLLPFGDEGRAMLQIVHDVAPGASLAFYTADTSETDFASGMVALANAGAKVIADDVGYYDEPFFQDGLLAQAVNQVKAQGVAFFSAAGNNGTLGYNNDAPSFAANATVLDGANEYLLNVDTSGANVATALPVTIPALVPGEYVAIVLEWDQPYVTGAPNSGGATSQLDLCLTNVSGSDTITDDNLQNLPTDCTGVNATGSDPVQIIIVGNPANAAGNSSQETFNIEVGLAQGSAAPGRLKLVVEDDGAGSTINSYATNSGTLQGHAGAAGAMAVGAAFYLNTSACGVSAPTLEAYSSAAGDPILFDAAGNRLATPVIRQKPDIAGPDGVNNTFLGFTLASAGITVPANLAPGCQTDANYPNFFGTSAATPHLAAVAALLLQAAPQLTPDTLYAALRGSAQAMVDSNSNPISGYGFVQADAAYAQLPPAAPVLTLGASTITLGSSTTISWTSSDDNNCVATGAWSGTKAPNGTNQSITPTAAGVNAYSLQCSNDNGSSPIATVNLTVNAATVSPPTAPTLALGASSITVGGSTTLTWSSSNATGCTASGSWVGAVGTSGSQTVSPTTAGTDTYTLVCNNSGGASPAASAMLTVNNATTTPTPPATGKHGGGALDWQVLLGLGGLVLLSRRQRRAVRAG